MGILLKSLLIFFLLGIILSIGFTVVNWVKTHRYTWMDFFATQIISFGVSAIVVVVVDLLILIVKIMEA